MANPSYAQPDLTLSVDGGGTPDQVQELQRDLRRLGYLRRTIDGAFGPGTRRAVLALQHDLLANDGRSSQGDGAAPVAITGYNGGRVTAPTGIVDQSLVACIVEMLDDDAYPKLPDAADPVAANRQAVQLIADMSADRVPPPWLLAILTQETGQMHYAVPHAAGDVDTFVIVGTDLDAADPTVIRSRGYGIGQYTLFHHPPRPEEVTGFITDPQANVGRAVSELREKFDSFVNGPASRADDRIAEAGAGPLRECTFPAGDPRHKRACHDCIAAAGTRAITMGTPVVPGSSLLWQPSPPAHPESGYTDVPCREKIPCDWPYAVRRYNGGGINSYHYQAKVMKHLAEQALP